jgi:hypothetical protein
MPKKYPNSVVEQKRTTDGNMIPDPKCGTDDETSAISTAKTKTFNVKAPINQETPTGWAHTKLSVVGFILFL